MIPAATFAGRVGADERLHLETPQTYARYIRQHIGQRMRLVLGRWPSDLRSPEANAYYWSVVVELIADYCGYTKEEAHEALKHKFLRETAEPVHGLVRVGSTAQLASSPFWRYVEDCRIFGATELGLYIPEPNEVHA